MKISKWSLSGLLAGFVLILFACGGVKPFEPLDAAQITTMRDTCHALYQRHIEAWDTRDTEIFRQVYTDEILWIDGNPADTGVNGLIEMGGVMFEIFPDWQMESGDVYISKDECLGTWFNWGVFDFPQENPGIEYDIIKSQDDKISYWRAFYDQKFHQAIDNADLVNDEFLAVYASAWSSGDVDAVMEIYAEDADLEDTLLGYSISGGEGIRDYASRFLTTSQDARWEVLYPFAESLPSFPYKQQHPYASQGAVYAVQGTGKDGSPCIIHSVVILTPNQEGLVQSQQIFYEADSLIACGWAK